MYIIYYILEIVYIVDYIIRHRAEGRSGVTSGVESFIHSFSSTSFQVEPPASGLRGSRWSSSPFLWSFLRGGMEIPCVSRRGLLPPSGAHFRYLVSSWRSWALSWIILALSGRILSPSCSKMAPRWPNIAQHSAKMSQHSLQEQPQDPKKPSKVMNCRRFFGFRHFW